MQYIRRLTVVIAFSFLAACGSKGSDGEEGQSNINQDAAGAQIPTQTDSTDVSGSDDQDGQQDVQNDDAESHVQSGITFSRKIDYDVECNGSPAPVPGQELYESAMYQQEGALHITAKTTESLEGYFWEIAYGPVSTGDVWHTQFQKDSVSVSGCNSYTITKHLLRREQRFLSGGLSVTATLVNAEGHVLEKHDTVIVITGDIFPYTGHDSAFMDVTDSSDGSNLVAGYQLKISAKNLDVPADGYEYCVALHENDFIEGYKYVQSIPLIDSVYGEFHVEAGEYRATLNLRRVGCTGQSVFIQDGNEDFTVRETSSQ